MIKLQENKLPRNQNRNLPRIGAGGLTVSGKFQKASAVRSSTRKVAGRQVVQHPHLNPLWRPLLITFAGGVDVSLLGGTPSLGMAGVIRSTAIAWHPLAAVSIRSLALPAVFTAAFTSCQSLRHRLKRGIGRGCV